MNEPLEGGGVLAPAGCGDSAPHLQPLGGGRQKLPPKRNRRALAGRTAHARACPCSPAATCLFHAAELLPSINSNLAWSLPLRPDPPWGLGLGRGGGGFRGLRLPQGCAVAAPCWASVSPAADWDGKERRPGPARFPASLRHSSSGTRVPGSVPNARDTMGRRVGRSAEYWTWAYGLYPPLPPGTSRPPYSHSHRGHGGDAAGQGD